VTFPSYSFALFFVVVLAISRAPSLLSWRARKGVLLGASWLFYAAWNPPFVVLLWVSTAVDWLIAKRLHVEQRDGARRSLLVLSLLVNLGLLGAFKYGDFAAENFVRLCAALGVPLELSPPGLVLPVGISFYTFQTLSYTIDVYRRRLAPDAPLLDYALYVSFFPQLVAGPIVRASTFLPQCRDERRATRDEIGWGLTLLALGLFEKVVLADALLARFADRVYAAAHAAGPADAWLGTLAFSGQIFCDFSGYSTCAIGVALCLGFHLPDNFRAPYGAVGFSDFWRRWHMSLSTWLRDYLYIPLGGNRHGQVRTTFALCATMLLGGLWHGAAWTFVAWGALHGVYLVVEHGLRSLPVFREATWLSARPARLALAALTFVCVTLAWVFFRAHGFDDATRLLGSMLLGTSPGAGPPLLLAHERAVVLVVVGGLLVAHQLLHERTLEERAARLPSWTRAVLVCFLLLCLTLSPGSDRAFLYFQF
jgi:alginate O-acetyltransferase complex protein AlgI